jgi:hypothetical protein
MRYEHYEKHLNSTLKPKKSLALAVPTTRKRRRPDHLQPSTSRQVVRAIRKASLCAGRNTQNAQFSHGISESRSPLVLITDEARKLLADGSVLLRKVDVRVKARDAGGRVVGLGVVVDVPLARGAVLRSVDGNSVGCLVEGCARGVSADESGELGGSEALVNEELEEAVVVGTGAEAWRHGVCRCCSTAVDATDDSLDLRATGTCDDCDAVGKMLAGSNVEVLAFNIPRGELDQISSSNSVAILSLV